MDFYDVIVIGGGLGGLTAGAKLAKEGNRVLLLEQHYIPGGCATVFKRKDFTMEVGLHELDGLDEDDRKTEIFADLGVFDAVEFRRLPEFYRFTNTRVDMVIPDHAGEAMEVLVKEFPAERKGIQKYFKTIHALHSEIRRLPLDRWKLALQLPIFPLLYPRLVLHTFTTLGNFLDTNINDEDLKLILLANLQYYHDDPYSMSLLFFSAAQASYYKGGYFIKGGSQKLSNHLAKVIKEHQGQVLLKHLVTRIITQDNKAVGVEYRKTSAKEPETKQAFADVVIANAAIPNVVGLLPEQESQVLAGKVDSLEKACSLISIYIGFNKEIKELGNTNYSTFVFDAAVRQQRDLLNNHRGDFAHRNFVFVDYSQIDSGLAPEGKSFGAVCTADYLADWQDLDIDAYKRKKEEVAQIFFARLEKIIPGITDAIEYYEVGTPKTIQRYTLNPEGTPYGFAQIPKQTGIFRIPNKSAIKNLYFASAWTNPGGGFTGAILSGWFCAREVGRVLTKKSKYLNHR